MRIGELAKAVDCHVETVRYYEREGLLPKAARTANGYRDYSDTHLKYLRLVRRSKELGFSQNQIRQLVALTESTSPCHEVHELTVEQLNVVNQKLRELRKMQLALKSLAAACEVNAHDKCPILERLVRD